MMSKFPATIKTASNAKAQHHAKPFALEGRLSVGDKEVSFEAVVPDVFFISGFYLNSDKVFTWT